MKDKKGITFTNAFQKTFKESNRKPNKIWVDKGSVFYNRSMKSFLQNNNIEMYSTHNEGMTSMSRNVHIDKLDDIVNKCNNAYHRTIKIKPVDVKPSTYIDPSKEINYENPEYKIGGIVRISKCKNIFANWSEEVFVIRNVKNTVPWTYVISDLKSKYC